MYYETYDTLCEHFYYLLDKKKPDVNTTLLYIYIDICYL